MKQMRELTTQRQEESAERVESNVEITQRHIDLLWERMTMIYGHRWTSSYGDRDDGTWCVGLSDLTVDQVKRGITKCRDRIPENGKEDWPPTLPEFRSLCILKHAAPYHRLSPRIPPPEPVNRKVVDKEIQKMRDVLRKMRENATTNDERV
jgi:hypothetical protein